MKILISFFVIFFHFSLTTQTESVVGTYEMRLEGSNALIIDTLVLNSNGTFIYHSYDKHDGGNPPERNFYGKGKWTLKNNIVSLIVDESDMDEKHTLNFNNSQARFITKSPRDKSDKVIPTSLKFFKSDNFWAAKRTLIKK